MSNDNQSIMTSSQAKTPDSVADASVSAPIKPTRPLTAYREYNAVLDVQLMHEYSADA
jgi:hypothetical protein